MAIKKRHARKPWNVWKARNKKLRAVLKFLVRFNLFAIPLYLILFSGYQSRLLMDITTDISFAAVELAKKIFNKKTAERTR